MPMLTAKKLSIVFGGGIFAVSLVGTLAGVAGLSVPFAIEGISALLGMVAGARVA